jgi:hypothetical protein
VVTANGATNEVIRDQNASQFDISFEVFIVSRHFTNELVGSRELTLKSAIILGHIDGDQLPIGKNIQVVEAFVELLFELGALHVEVHREDSGIKEKGFHGWGYWSGVGGLGLFVVVVVEMKVFFRSVFFNPTPKIYFGERISPKNPHVII